MAKARKKVEKNIIKLGKNFVVSKADKVRDRLLKLPDQGTKEIVMDFARVKALDAVGLGVIIAAHNTAKNAGGNLTLINVSEELHSFFSAIKLKFYAIPIFLCAIAHAFCIGPGDRT